MKVSSSIMSTAVIHSGLGKADKREGMREGGREEPRVAIQRE
jgi:hypothetical protein